MTRRKKAPCTQPETSPDERREPSRRRFPQRGNHAQDIPSLSLQPCRREVVEQRFRACNEVAATIVRAGHVVFSQVSMSHPINLCLAELDRAAIGRLWRRWTPSTWITWKS